MVDVRKKVINHGINSRGELVAMQVTENGGTNVGNAYKKFRDGFAALAQDAAPDPAFWTGVWTNQGNGFAGRRGNSTSSCYICVSMDPTVAGSEYVLESVRTFRYPMRMNAAISSSVRVQGNEIEVSAVSATNGVTDTLTPKADLAISGSITVTTNVATINFATAHGLVGGDRVLLKGNADSRLNVGPVVVTIVTPTQITVPLVLANATYTAGGSVQWADYFKYSPDAAGCIYDTASIVSAFMTVRRSGFNTRASAISYASIAGIQANTSPYTDSYNPTSRMEFKLDQEESVFGTRLVNSLLIAPALFRYTQGMPDEEKEYKIRFRVKNLENLTVPVAKIVSATKTGTTTATIVTSTAHGLNALDVIQIVGVRDQTNFPNLVAATAIASIVDATTFTVVIGPAVSIASTGGAVYRNNGGVLAPGLIPQSIQSISRASNVLTLVGSAAWATPIPGENMQIYGCEATSMGLYDGAYKVLRVSTTSLELESVGADFGSINCGGAVIRRHDMRVHFVSEIEYTRLITELAQSNGLNDQSRSLAVNASLNASQTLDTVTTAGLQIPITVVDIASAAITVTATTAAVIPAQGVSYQVNIPITAVTGTTPTLDVSIEESDDAGINWFKVYDFPRITATGIYRSPVINSSGNRIRYVQTVAGTTPSFTRSLNRLQIHEPGQFYRQLIDRTIVPNTLNSTSGALLVPSTTNFNLVVRCSAQTTPATIALQYSYDNVNWFTSATTVTTAVGIVQAKATNEKWNFVRAIVTAAGTGITLTELVISGSDV